jgi:methionyl-tRNA synthetase
MKTLITSALPYANGPLHLGHLAGVYIPADIYTRHKKLQKEETLHICGSDEHGVGIIKKAREAKQSYKDYVEQWRNSHQETFEKWSVHFDHYSKTSNNPLHEKESQQWFEHLQQENFIEKAQDLQWQCQDCKEYLPDRFILGTCYNCGFDKARGDECSKCGEWIEASKLLQPECQFCFSKNLILQEDYQYVLKTSLKQADLQDWLNKSSPEWRPWVKDYVQSFYNQPLVSRTISRNLDWGILVPNEKEKRLYVWFDAPIGYVTFLKELGKEWNDYKIIQFLGKDNVIFHGIIFPMMCLGNHHKPADILVGSQYLNISSEKLSKSDSSFSLKDLEEKYPIEYLRYYLITTLPQYQDSEFSEDQLISKVNTDLANVLGNLYSRVLKFYLKNNEPFFTFKRCYDYQFPHLQLLDEIKIKESLEELMNYVRFLNKEITEKAPWKQEGSLQKAILEEFLAELLLISMYFQPFVPTIAKKLQNIFHFSEEFYPNIASLENKQFSLHLPEEFFPKLL